MSEKDFESTRAMEQAFIDFADSKGLEVGRHNGRESMAHLGLDSPARYEAEIWLRLHTVVFVDVKSVTAENEDTGHGSISLGCLLNALQNRWETYFVQYPGSGHEDADGIVQGWTYGDVDWLITKAQYRPCCDSCWGLFGQEKVRRVCPRPSGSGDQPFLLYHLDSLKPINELLLPNGEPSSE